MKTRSQKTQTNLALKIAVIERRITQREVAKRAGIGEVRLSLIVRGAEPTDDERRSIAKVLRRTIADLFPAGVHEEAAAS